MEISPRKPSKRAQEPIDEWLQNEGYFRKHAPRDATCLFRAVSEQVYMTQHYHIKVRKECVEFMKKMKHMFLENITIPFDDYLEQMACFTEWGGMTEIQAMSLLYKREFVILNGQKQASRTVTNNGFKDMIYLCHTPQKQYESIYTRDFVATAAYCQSIVYQILYKDVFQMANIETTVHKMLHDRTATFRHDKFFLKGNLEIRDQLATEIYNKVDSGIDEVDDAQSIIKNIPPFPYRIAKALDPNIYRNTDFDIWHEIRREVKNAGWSRHNSHELQIGGKCLVQVDFTEEDFDKTNNNNIYVSSLEKDSNSNDTKVLQKKAKEPIFYYGHIQEMSKNQGPVLVFIEELGEKRVVPYSALKPLPPKKSKQANWLPVCKKNLILDSNQKWKKASGATSRKIKDSTNVNILSNNIDKNENNNNIANDINKNNFQWKEGQLKVEHQEYENYSVEKCPNYPVNNSVEMFPARMILDNPQSPTIDIVKQENNKEHKEKCSFSHKNSENNFVRSSKPDNGTNNDNNADFNSYSKQGMQKEMHYSLYADSNTQMDHMLRSINCSVQKSIDINGSDLPLSDPFTLRFFYNLGLEYFRGGANWNYLTNGHSSDFGHWYQGVPQNEEEITNITNSMIQDCTLTQQKKEYNSDRKEIGIQSLCQENGDKYVNGITDMQIQKTEGFRGDDEKDMSYPSRGKIKEQESINKESSHISRNGLGPRFKKNSENRHRSSHFSNQCSANGSNSKASKLEKDAKEDNTNNQYSHSIHHQLHPPVNTINTYQASYMQQGMYSGLSYYTNEAEAFANPYYSLNAGFISIPCLPHSDIPDNNVQPFSPHLYPGIDYTQAYSGLCPPYLYPPPTPFNIPPQNVSEHWYAVAGQPHYMQCAPVLPVPAETTCNGIVQNTNQNISS
ncbi:PREDICTED: hybrid signal transduction histidine kinase M-like [Eufriesea mexicana]|uniref:hybrid signal transduction histidine kinase M-like n=1 Tax=Eufriesea mexicana TaxID=516756 RepID=UPI00083C86C8|nr:PREDICTED: hybrid signal transduction histidine kinase M-like [Eufriesea mexicana]